MKKLDDADIDEGKDIRPFAEKWGIVGQGIPVSIGPGTLDTVAVFSRECNNAVADGEDYKRIEKGRFNRGRAALLSLHR